MKIDDDLPTDVLIAVARGCGFHLNHDVTPGADEWTLWAGHGATYVTFVGTRKAVCAFLAGYSAMHVRTVRLFDQLEEAYRAVRFRVDESL